MKTATETVALAAGEIGTVESPPKSNRTKYGIEYGWNGVAWCAIFMWWVETKAGVALPKTASVYDLRNAFERSGTFHITPQVGDIVLYDYGTGHCGIVESFTETTITAIEGNTSLGNDTNGGSVMRRIRSRNGLIFGYGRPVYALPPSPTPPPPPQGPIYGDDEEMPLGPGVEVSEYRWPTGELVRLSWEGNVANYLGAPYCGSIADIPADGRKNWANGKGAIGPAFPGAPASAGYRIMSEDARMDAGMTPAFWKSLGH